LAEGMAFELSQSQQVKYHSFKCTPPIFQVVRTFVFVMESYICIQPW